MSADSAWVAIAKEGEIDNDAMKAVTVGDKRLLLVNAGGRLYLVDEMCTHEDYSLALGCIKDKRIKCSLHGSYFDLETGTALDEPASDPIGTYPVKIESGQIWARAD